MAIRKNTKAKTGLSAFSSPQEDTARCAITPDGQIVYANDAFYELTGIKENKTSETSIFEILQFADERLISLKSLENIPAGIHQIYLQNGKITASFRFDWLKGPNQSHYLVASALKEESSAPSQKIPENFIKTVEKAKKKEKSRPWLISDLQDLTEFSGISHDIMIVTDIQGKIQRANDTFYKNFGFLPQDLPSLTFQSLFPESQRAHVRSTMQTLIKESKQNENAFPRIVDFESQIITKNGLSRWVEWRQKYIGGLIYAAGRDITDIRMKHDNLLIREKQLSEAEAIAHMGHWRWPIGALDIAWSEELYNIFGVLPETFTPTIENLSELLSPEDAERLLQIFQRATIEKKDYDIELRIERPDGQTRHILCEGRCEKDAEGDVTALYGIMQDMTERLLYEQELRTARDAAQQAYAAKSRFLANMSHELRTPLNAIIGFSEIMEKQIMGPLGNDKYHEYAQGIRESGSHLLSLIGDILDMSKIEAGKYELDYEEFSLENAIERAEAMIRSRAESAGVTLDILGKIEKSLKIVADRRAIVQIILNLLSNAVKFTPEGGNVHLEFSEEKDSVSLTISDTGIGIPRNKLESVLRPFEQVSPHETRSHEGSGLGLSITKELVELHHGSLTLSSQEDKGTRVTIWLPLDTSKKPKKR